MRAHLFGLLTVSLLACGTDVRDDDTPDPDPQPRATWYQDVAPIVAEHCMGCHSAGGIGPFDLTSYDIASENAGRMLHAIETGVMPPFDAREEADCTPRFGWQDDPRLDAEEIETIQLWIDDGLAEGTVAEIAQDPMGIWAGCMRRDDVEMAVAIDVAHRQRFGLSFDDIIHRQTEVAVPPVSQHRNVAWRT